MQCNMLPHRVLCIQACQHGLRGCSHGLYRRGHLAVLAPQQTPWLGAESQRVNMTMADVFLLH